MSFSLNGLASGLDTGTIISQLMQLERIPYQKLEQKQTSMNSNIAIFRSINTKLSALRTASDELLLNSNFNLRSATNSDETVLKATVSEEVAETSFNIKITNLAKQHIIKSDSFLSSGTDLVFDEESGEKQIIVSGKPISLSGSTNEEVLTNLMNEINAGKLGVKASIVETKPGFQTLVLTSENYGTANSFKIGDKPADSPDTDTNIYISENGVPESTEEPLLAKLGFIIGENIGETVEYKLNQAQPAEDALVNINGIDIVSSSNELNNVITGLNLTLLKENSEATINVTKDADKIAEKVEAFVKAYNDVINTIKSNTSKGKALQGDSTLRSLESHLTQVLNRKVGGDDSLSYLFEIGLEIDKGITDGSLMTGTISFDKEKFKEMLAERPDEVYELFSYNGDKSELGIARLFKDSLMDWTRSGTGILAARIDGYDKDISFLRKQMEDMTTRLDLREAQLKRQFTAMESALVQLQNQQMWMASQIASMGIY